MNTTVLIRMTDDHNIVVFFFSLWKLDFWTLRNNSNILYGCTHKTRGLRVGRIFYIRINARVRCPLVSWSLISTRTQQYRVWVRLYVFYLSGKRLGFFLSFVRKRPNGFKLCDKMKKKSIKNRYTPNAYERSVKCSGWIKSAYTQHVLFPHRKKKHSRRKLSPLSLHRCRVLCVSTRNTFFRLIRPRLWIFLKIRFFPSLEFTGFK